MLHNKKLLFVSSNISSTQTGGGVCSMRNLDICRRVLGEENVELYALKAFSSTNKNVVAKLFLILKALLKLFLGYSNGSTWGIDRDIVQIVEEGRFDFVFIDSSLNGHLVKRLKLETAARVICFFHNCEKSMVVGLWKTGDISSVFRLFTVTINENITCKYADRIIVLNERDYGLVNINYKRNADLLLPISLKDTLLSRKIEKKRIGNLKKGLFVGSFFFGNVEGLKLFIDKVLPFVDMQLVVVGRGMSRLKNSNPKVIIYDGVESIEPFYLDADFVIAPITSGGGMKVKIAEAMMYGKIIIGTPEAFQGYGEIPCSYVCEKAVDFIQAINSLSGYSYNISVREYFLKKYETNVILDDFRKLLL